MFCRKASEVRKHFSKNFCPLPPMFCIVTEMKTLHFPGQPNAFSPSFSYINDPEKKTQNKKETWATALDTLDELHSKVKYMHAVGTLSVTAWFSYLLLLISSVRGGPSRATVLLRWAAELCKAKQKSECQAGHQRHSVNLNVCLLILMKFNV